MVINKDSLFHPSPNLIIDEPSILEEKTNERLNMDDHQSKIIFQILNPRISLND